MARIAADIRSGLNLFVRNPGFSAVAVLTLGLGVGVSGAVFSMVSGTLINPTPWTDAGRVSLLWDQSRDREDTLRPISYPRYKDLRAQARVFSELGAARSFTFVLNEGSLSDAVSGAYVEPQLFGMLGLAVELGRPLTAADAEPSAPPAVVIDHATWRTRYGSDPDIVGKKIELDGRPANVVGVLDRGDWFPEPGTALLAALRPSVAESRNRELRNLLVVGRLAPEARAAEVKAELDLISARLSDEHPATDDPAWRLHTQSVSEAMFGGPERAGIVLLSGALCLLLLIACANLTGLLLTRAMARQREIAVRAAVGASRRQIVGQLLTENLVLAAAAVPVALVVTRLTLEFMYAQVPPQVTSFEQTFRFDAPVWTFAGGVALFTVLAFGLTPALQASRVDLSRALKEGGERGSSSGGGSQRLRSLLVVTQLALSVVMLVGASQLGETFYRIVNADPGFEMENLFYAPVQLPDTRYRESEQRVTFVRRLTDRLERIGGIEHVGISDSSVSVGRGPTRAYTLASKGGASGGDRQEARWTAGTPGYIASMGLRLIAGRYLTDADDSRAPPVALVSELFVQSNFGSGESAVGDFIVLEGGPRVQIVGVVQDVNQIGITGVQRPQVYVPYAQQPSSFLQLVARTAADPLSVGPSVRAAFEELDPLIPVLRLTTGRRERALSVWPLGLFAAVLALLGGIGLAMACVGIYGVIRYSTQQRTREFGVRAALGAEPVELVLLVMRGTAILTGSGLLLGLALSIGLGSALTAVLYDTGPIEPLSLLGPSALLAASALLAGALPAVRASQVDPTLALSAD